MIKKSFIALAFGTLGLGMSEYVMMGVLPDVAAAPAVKCSARPVPRWRLIWGTRWART
jgi:predicted MFS family arabinose efflux permease